ncbi:hypothetical protein N9Y89_00065 [bacterium]|nr:hypothetical protein [bacterium]
MKEQLNDYFGLDNIVITSNIPRYNEDLKVGDARFLHFSLVNTMLAIINPP